MHAFSNSFPYELLIKWAWNLLKGNNFINRNNF